MRPWIAIQQNPQSGAGPNRKRILELVSHLRRLGIRPRVFTDRGRLEQRLKRPQSRQELVCIVAAGGDGTVADVINRFPGLPVAILPLGTENLLARYLGIPRSGRAVAELIEAGRTRRLDLGDLNGRRFVLMASFGFDADVVHRTDARRTGHIRKADYLQPIWRSLRKYRHPELRGYVGDAETPVTARLAVVANLPAYAMRLRIAGSARGDDGLLDLRLFQRGSAFQMLRYFYKVLVGAHERLQDVQLARAARIRIVSDVPVPVQTDGDPAGRTPAEIRVLPGELEVFVPKTEIND